MRASRVLCALALLAVLGCGGSKSRTIQDLEILALEVLTPDAQTGHGFEIHVWLSAQTTAVDVPITFLLADAADVAAGLAEPVLELLGTAALHRVDPGDHCYITHVFIPGTILPGTYYVVAVVDPLNAVAEDDESNNAITGDRIREIGVVVVIANDMSGTTDLVLERISLNSPAADVDVSPEAHAPVTGIADVPNSHIGVTALVRASGTQTLSNVVLKAKLDLGPLGVHDLLKWDTTTGTYTPCIVIPTLEPDEPTALHLDLLIPDSALAAFAALPELQQADPEEDFLYACRVTVEVDPDDEIDEHEDGILLRHDEDGDDNCESAHLVLFPSHEDEDVHGPIAGAPPPNRLSWEVPFVSTFTNDKVGIGIHCGAKAEVGKNGVFGKGNASVPLTLLGFTFNLLDLEAKGLYNPANEKDNGFAVTLKALAIKVYEKQIGNNKDLKQDPLSFTKEQKASANFLVGPVPVFVTLKARGTLGLKIGAAVGDRFEVFADPFVDFTVVGEGGVGGSYLGFTLGAGVGASIQLVKDTFHTGITADVSYDSATKTMTASLTEEVSNDLKGPSGRVFLFATVDGRILWKVINQRFELTLVKWETFEKKDTLFNRTQMAVVTFD